MKVLKRDSVDILFWLTLHDTMNIHDLILRNVSRAMRSFAIGAEESVVLVKQDRFFTVLKELIKSKNEDVLWQTAGMIYNIMQVDVCLKKMLERYTKTFATLDSFVGSANSTKASLKSTFDAMNKSSS